MLYYIIFIIVYYIIEATEKLTPDETSCCKFTRVLLQVQEFKKLCDIAKYVQGQKDYQEKREADKAKIKKDNYERL